MEKIYTVICEHRGRETEYTGTLDHLVNEVFGYLLDCGATWSHAKGCVKVNTNPRTGKGLITALNNAVENTQGGCFHRDHYRLKEV